jgi:outer membrane protein assembly factor BamB
MREGSTWTLQIWLPHRIQITALLFASLWLWNVSGAPGDLRWQMRLGSCILGAPTLATNGDLLVGTSDGLLYSITAEGSNRWSFSTGINISGSPVVAEDGTIYFGSDKLCALNPDGSKRWEFVLETYSSWNVYAEDPVIGPDGVLYVMRPFAPDGERRLYAINPDGTLRWKLNGRFQGECVVGADGAVYGPSQYAGGFTCVNPDGIVRWSLDLNVYVLAPAALAADGTVLVAVNDSNFRGAVQALTPAGVPMWRFEGVSRAASSPIVGPGGEVYYGFDDGRVVALDAAGHLQWDYTMPGTNAVYRISATPALAGDGTLYFAGEHYLHALNAAGQLLWRFDAGTNSLDAPLIGPDGTVYCGDTAGTLFAVEGTGAGLAAGQWPMSHRNARHQASIATTLSPPPTPAGVVATVSNYTDKVLVTWTSAPPATHYVVLRSETPDFADAQELTDSVTGITSFEDRSAVAGSNYFYFVQARNLAGLSAPVGPVAGARRGVSIGEAVWIFQTGGSVSSPAIAPDGTVIFGSTDGNLYAAYPDGLPKWTFTYGGASCSPPSVAADGTVYFGAAVSRYPKPVTNGIFAVSSTGQLLWRRIMDSSMVSGVAIGANGTLYVTTDDFYSPDTLFVQALSPEGSNVWRFANGRRFVSTPAIGADGTIYAGTSDGMLEAIRPNGTLLWEFNSGDGYLKTPVINANGVLFTAGASFHAINPDGQRLWSYALQYGADSGPSCLDPANVIFAQGDYTYCRVNSDGSSFQKFVLPASPDRTLSRVVRDANGTIYVSVYSGVYSDMLTGKIYALTAGGVKQWEYSLYQVAFGGATLGTGNVLYVPGSDTQALRLAHCGRLGLLGLATSLARSSTHRSRQPASARTGFPVRRQCHPAHPDHRRAGQLGVGCRRVELRHLPLSHHQSVGRRVAGVYHRTIVL